MQQEQHDEGRTRHIGAVAETLGLSHRTIRYWDEMEVVRPSGRSTGGYRLYTRRDIDRLRLVKNMKWLELSIDEMRDVIEVRDAIGNKATPAHERVVLIQRLQMYVTLIDERCKHLRNELEQSEAAGSTLRSELADFNHNAL